ncbi:MAG: IclR family transcriptional regulator [Bacillota bacterium]
MENKKIIKSVQKSLQILKYINAADGEVGISELQKALGFSAATIHHLLQTLMAEGFVSQNEQTKKYDSGREFFFVSLEHRRFEKFFARAMPYLQQLTEEAGESSGIFIQSGWESICVLSAITDRYLRAELRVGKRIPLYCTATGKVFLAAMPADRLAAYFNNVNLAAYTPGTVTERDTVIKQIERVKKEGYGTEYEEYEEGINAAGVPLWGPNDKVIAVLTVVAPASRLPAQRVAELIPELKKRGRCIAKTMASAIYY